MIRFLNLKDQICEGDTDFAFYNTVICEIITIDGEQVWDSIDQFKDAYKAERGRLDDYFDRLFSLIPDDFFALAYPTDGIIDGIISESDLKILNELLARMSEKDKILLGEHLLTRTALCRNCNTQLRMGDMSYGFCNIVCEARYDSAQ